MRRRVGDRYQRQARRSPQSFAHLLARPALAVRRGKTHSFDISQVLLTDDAACEGFFGRLSTEVFDPLARKTSIIELVDF